MASSPDSPPMPHMSLSTAVAQELLLDPGKEEERLTQKVRITFGGKKKKWRQGKVLFMFCSNMVKSSNTIGRT